MGGLKKELPVVYWTFLIGSASLAALPLVTAGFYSKDQIVWLALAGERGNGWLYLAALTGAFLTALYTRSEEHTSELQSLMRISYAVFCLKKTKQHNNNK